MVSLISNISKSSVVFSVVKFILHGWDSSSNWDWLTFQPLWSPVSSLQSPPLAVNCTPAPSHVPAAGCLPCHGISPTLHTTSDPASLAIIVCSSDFFFFFCWKHPVPKCFSGLEIACSDPASLTLWNCRLLSWATTDTCCSCCQQKRPCFTSIPQDQCYTSNVPPFDLDWLHGHKEYQQEYHIHCWECWGEKCFMCFTFTLEMFDRGWLNQYSTCFVQ